MYKKFLYLLIIFSLSACGNYALENNKINAKEDSILEQRAEDKLTCKYYGFKENTSSFSDCLMNLDIARKQQILTRKMLECEAVRRDNNQSAATGFWAGVLKGARENLACN